MTKGNKDNKDIFHKFEHAKTQLIELTDKLFRQVENVFEQLLHSGKLIKSELSGFAFSEVIPSLGTTLFFI